MIIHLNFSSGTTANPSYQMINYSHITRYIVVEFVYTLIWNELHICIDSFSCRKIHPHCVPQDSTMLYIWLFYSPFTHVFIVIHSLWYTYWPMAIIRPKWIVNTYFFPVECLHHIKYDCISPRILKNVEDCNKYHFFLSKL